MLGRAWGRVLCTLCFAVFPLMAARLGDAPLVGFDPEVIGGLVQHARGGGFVSQLERRSRSQPRVRRAYGQGVVGLRGAGGGAELKGGGGASSRRASRRGASAQSPAADSDQDQVRP
jgi:hypothetical protein